MVPAFELSSFAEFVAGAIIVAALLQGTIHIGEILTAARHFRRNPHIVDQASLWRRFSGVAPGISILAPAYNEQETIEVSVKSLLSVRYPNVEVIVINDGSRDETLAVLKRAFGLKKSPRRADSGLAHQPVLDLYRSTTDPRLIVIDKVNGGKADALNAGINAANYALFCAVDADSILEADALVRAAAPFIDDPDRIIAVGGTVRLANGCTIKAGHVTKIGVPRTLLGMIQTVEYLRAFLMSRLAWSHLNALTIVSGAFGLFAREPVIAVGGYRTGTVGEDMELIVRLHRAMLEANREYKICFLAEPVCWTQAPETLRDLGRQRSRWHRGMLETFFNHADMVLVPRYRNVGLMAFPSMILVDLIGPILECVGIILIPILTLTGTLSVVYLMAFLSVTLGFGMLCSVAALCLEEVELRRFPRASDLLKLLLAAILENIGYRQLSNFWRLRGIFQFLSGSGEWGAMSRTAFRSGATT
jgi:cellulose synthase/poly-beta-1,6-N-acetylglucosamine synthase-like glycosyltransferase